MNNFRNPPVLRVPDQNQPQENPVPTAMSAEYYYNYYFYPWQQQQLHLLNYYPYSPYAHPVSAMMIPQQVSHSASTPSHRLPPSRYSKSATLSFRQNNSTLVLKDMPPQGQKKDIIRMFESFGPIEKIQIFHQTKSALLTFTHRQSAQRALQEMNGRKFFGKVIQLQWARGESANAVPSSVGSPLDKIREEDKNAPGKERSQVYVKFVSTNSDVAISEEALRNEFTVFGEIATVAIPFMETNQVFSFHSSVFSSKLSFLSFRKLELNLAMVSFITRIQVKVASLLNVRLSQ
jgi:RNA recognition motif-containing protein